MDKIQVNMVLEILGRPKENVSEAMLNITNKLAAEKLVARCIDKQIHEPVLVKDSKDLYTTFAEMTLEFNSLLDCIMVMFAYMPSHVEIISPEKIVLRNDETTLISAKLMQRLHDYDAVVKNTLMQKDILTKKLFEVAPQLFKKPDTAQPAQAESNEQEEVKEVKKTKAPKKVAKKAKKPKKVKKK